ncbi:MAG: PIN domain-containing protein [Pirellulales bacterium]|nr:PIN domain-containing protein [Pirellulales bacterium]
MSNARPVSGPANGWCGPYKDIWNTIVVRRMIYLLDTYAWISYLNDIHGNVVKRAVPTDFKQIRLYSIVLAELFFGAFRSQRRAHNLALIEDLMAEFESVSFDGRAARICGELRANLVKNGRPVGAYDLLIASLALANDLTVATHNLSEYPRVPRLRVEDWEAGR